MRRTLFVSLFVLLFSVVFLYAENGFERKDLSYIPYPEIELNTGGLGNVIAGVDLDGDGLQEMYVVNENSNDTESELVPRIYKYEYDGSSWNIVWHAELTGMIQNTWPGLAIADLDNDGKQEVVWGPVNFLNENNQNPSRIVVFEVAGDGSDVLGVDDGNGNYIPNAQTPIIDEEGVELRPTRFVVKDIDGDGTQEVIFNDRRGSSGGTYFGVVSVDDVPDDASGLEIWELEATASDFDWPTTSSTWDVVAYRNTIYLFDFGGGVVRLEYKDDEWQEPVYQENVTGYANGSFNTAMVVDIDGDGTEEIVYPNYYTEKDTVNGIQGNFLNVCKVNEDGSLEAHIVAKLMSDDDNVSNGARISGSAFGDIDNDGKMDFVFGTRNSTPAVSVFRVSYKGGDIFSEDSYEISRIDSEVADGGMLGAMHIVNVDDDDYKEVLYTSTYMYHTDMITPIVALDYTGGGTPGKVKVTIIANTATVPDTIGPSSVVQVRGGMAPLTWDGASNAVMENVDGDYWKVTLEFNPGDTVQYKFFTNAEHDTIYPGCEWEHNGWECNTSDPSGNRILIVPDHDTTLPVQFVNGIAHGKDQYFRPYETNDSTIAVYVRVNMQGWEEFNPDDYIIGIRGSNNVDWGETGEISWGKTYPLEPESNHPNAPGYPGKYFYHGTIHVPNTYAGNAIEFKVVVHHKDNPLDEDWGNMVYNPDQQIHVDLSETVRDTTVHWFWFDNLVPQHVEHSDTVVVNFNVDLTKAIETNGFSTGDTIIVKAGFNRSALEMKEVTLYKQGFSDIYAAPCTLVTTVGEKLYYLYYKMVNGQADREIFYDFYDTSDDVTLHEKRKIDITGSIVDVYDTTNSETDVHRMPQFKNSEPISQDVTLYLECDARPAIYQLLKGDTLEHIQQQGDPNTTITPEKIDSVLIWGIYVNGPLTGSWHGWNPTDLADWKMYDDGTNGDLVAGDSIFTITIHLYKDSNDTKGQEFKFGINGWDNEGGYGNNHIINVNDQNSEYRLRIDFGSIDPVKFDAWDFNNHIPVDVAENNHDNVKAVYSLKQNYPNPFNPSTTIEFTLAKPEKVELKIYDITGRLVKTLVNTEMSAGSHKVVWDGTNKYGKTAPSGVYFYSIKTKDFSKIRKMVMLK